MVLCSAEVAVPDTGTQITYDRIGTPQHKDKPFCRHLPRGKAQQTFDDKRRQQQHPQPPEAAGLDLQKGLFCISSRLSRFRNSLRFIAYSSQNSSSNVFPSTLQMLRHRLIVGLYSPFSMALMVWRDTPPPPPDPPASYRARHGRPSASGFCHSLTFLSSCCGFTISFALHFVKYILLLKFIFCTKTHTLRQAARCVL